MSGVLVSNRSYQRNSLIVVKNQEEECLVCDSSSYGDFQHVEANVHSQLTSQPEITPLLIQKLIYGLAGYMELVERIMNGSVLRTLGVATLKGGLDACVNQIDPMVDIVHNRPNLLDLTGNGNRPFEDK